MKTRDAVPAPQPRLLLGQAQALTSDQSRDWLGNFLKKHGLKPIVQSWLNDAGLRMVEHFGQVGVCNVSALARLWRPGRRAPNYGRARDTPVTLRLAALAVHVSAPVGP